MMAGHMRVYVANFGRENFAWPQCLERGEIATMQDHRVHDFWRNGDRKEYIDFCVANLRTMKGIAPTRPVAGRWYNLGTIITESSGDLWLHQDGKYLWWTKTTDLPAIIELGPDFKPTRDEPPEVYFYRKPALAWSNRNKMGALLDWRGLHPKTPDFLTTEATFQGLSDDYADYAIALIEGADLDAWHRRSEWRAKTATGSRRAPVTAYGDKKLTFYDMAYKAWHTANGANGQEVLRTVKLKHFHFTSKDALADYVSDLYEAQEGLCALTGLQLQFKNGEDAQLCCSLDRIDSAGHYAAGNLQIVCRFANFWKAATDDGEFRRLLEIVRVSTGF